MAKRRPAVDTRPPRAAGVAARGALLLVAAVSLGACASAPASPPLPNGVGAPRASSPSFNAPARDEIGIASWYGDAYQGRRTASGERFEMREASAAHPSLPLPCWVEVTNLENGRALKVRVNDRLPRGGGRVLDLSRGAAERLGFLSQGVARVRVRYLGPAGPGPASTAALTVGRASARLDLDAIADGRVGAP